MLGLESFASNKKGMEVTSMRRCVVPGIAWGKSRIATSAGRLVGREGSRLVGSKVTSASVKQRPDNGASFCIDLLVIFQHVANS